MLILALVVAWFLTAADAVPTLHTVMLRAPDAALSEQIDEGERPVLTFAVYLDPPEQLFVIKDIVWDQMHVMELDDDALEMEGDMKKWHEIRAVIDAQTIPACKSLPAGKCVGFTLGAFQLVTKLLQPSNSSHWFRLHSPIELESVNATTAGRRLLETLIIADETTTTTFRCQTCAFREPAWNSAAIAFFSIFAVFLFLCVIWVLLDTYDYENRRREKMIYSMS